MTTLEQCYTDPLSTDPNWLCLLHLMFAIGLVMASPAPGSHEDSIINRLRADQSVDRAEMFYANAKNLSDPSTGFEDSGFWSIQALTLMSVYMLVVSRRNAAYAYYGRRLYQVRPQANPAQVWLYVLPLLWASTEKRQCVSLVELSNL